MRGCAVGWGTALQTERSRVWLTMGSLEFCIDLILPAALWSWGRLSLWQKWVPWSFVGGKGGQWVGLTTLPPSCPRFLRILGDSTFWSPEGLARSVMGYVFFYTFWDTEGVHEIKISLAYTPWICKVNLRLLENRRCQHVHPLLLVNVGTVMQIGVLVWLHCCHRLVLTVNVSSPAT